METVVTSARVWNTLKISHEVSDVSKFELGACACKFGALTAGPHRFVLEPCPSVDHCRRSSCVCKVDFC